MSVTLVKVSDFDHHTAYSWHAARHPRVSRARRDAFGYAVWQASHGRTVANVATYREQTKSAASAGYIRAGLRDASAYVASLKARLEG